MKLARLFAKSTSFPVCGHSSLKAIHSRICRPDAPPEHRNLGIKAIEEWAALK